MSKITFLGAGSSVFAKNLLGDCMTVPALQDFEIALFDIDHDRLKDSERMLKNVKRDLGSTVEINSYTNRKDALRNAKYVINAIQVGGYEPSTVIDFEIPKKYGLRQTIEIGRASCRERVWIRMIEVGFNGEDDDGNG